MSAKAQARSFTSTSKSSGVSSVSDTFTGDPSGPYESRGAAWDFVHVCIDDHFRVAFSEIKPDETADSAVPFLKAAVAYYKSLGVTVTRVMTDNGSFDGVETARMMSRFYAAARLYVNFLSTHL
ncbi:integrase-like protein [Bradyrhizobium stylosanthis]|uniref:Integrase-like protein n=1 Tax=Bradyrhizobium stylosanthis TaxID=1803665 RepID=A0A560D4P1_9BRAD|nr:integrase-like protein [Bradyrhizobium stylosanthis]